MKLQWIDKFDGHLQRELHDFYSREWWTEGRSFEEMVSMIGHSDIVIGCRQLTDARLIGFARVLTDYTFKAMIFDVIVHSEFRGHGIGGAILDRIMSNKALDKIRNFELYCPERLVPYYEKQGFVRRTSLLLKYERESAVSTEVKSVAQSGRRRWVRRWCGGFWGACLGSRRYQYFARTAFQTLAEYSVAQMLFLTHCWLVISKNGSKHAAPFH